MSRAPETTPGRSRMMWRNGPAIGEAMSNSPAAARACGAARRAPLRGVADTSLVAAMLVATLLVGCAPAADAGGDAPAGSAPLSDWFAYGGDAGGTRYSSLAQIDRSNVGGLEVAWTYRTGDFSHDDDSQGPATGCAACHQGDSRFEATPILADGRLYIGTPFNRVIALDPGDGTELWRYDPEIDIDLRRNEGFISRGVSYWQEPGDASGPCAKRVIMPTVDARLISLDATTGAPCAAFGEGGTVRLDLGVGEVRVGNYGVTSPPAVVGDVIVVGSSIGDAWRVRIAHGTVRAYDARTGALRWSWDPVPRSPDDPAWETWPAETAPAHGTGNAWAPLSADPGRDLVFVPTGASTPDYYGGIRPGRNDYTNSVVALRASTGEVVWHFQVVHHDMWDFDVPAQPSLITVPIDGRDVPAVAVGTKMGFVFILDRETGEPLFPIEERPVPQGAVPGEAQWPTQPVPVKPAPLHPTTFSRDDLFALTPEDMEACRATVEGFRFGDIFTPPSIEGTVMYPGYAGGINWGGMSWDRERNLLVTNLLRVAMWVRLLPRDGVALPGTPDELPYGMSRAVLIAPSGLPCSPPPWGTLVAVDLATGDPSWEVPLGQIPALAEVPGSEEWGSPTMGGSIVTAGGLVFIGATMDPVLRAFDVETGELVWRGDLPAGGNATPMTYEWEGRQYVVIAAGGHSNLGSALGDHVVAFALPER